MATTGKRHAPSEKVLLVDVDNNYDIINYLIRTLPEDIGKSNDDVYRHIHKLKTVKDKYNTASIALSKMYLNNGAIERCKHIKQQRHNTLDEVMEYIKLANIYLSSQDADVVSNFDISSIKSLPSTYSGCESALSRSLENLNMNTPENVSNSGKVDNLLNNVSSVTFAVSEIQDPISTSNINVTAATEKSFPQFVHYSSNFVHTSRPVNTSPMSTYQSQLYGNYVPSYNSNQINMYPYRAPVMPNTISSGLQLNCQPSNIPICATPLQSNANVNAQFTNSNVPYPVYAHHGVPQVQIGAPVNYHQAQNSSYFPQASNINSINVPENNIAAAHNMQVPLGAPNALLDSSCMYGNDRVLPAADPMQTMLNYLATQDITKDSITNFDGHAYKFRMWFDQIKTRIQQLPSLTPNQISHILLSNCSGPPHQMVQTFLNSSGPVTSEVMKTIWTALEERYGGQNNIARDIFSKLEAIKTIDDKKNVGVQIQNMHDICKIAEFNISKSPELLMLNFANGLQSLRIKLPKHLQDRWRRSGQKYENQHNGLHPPFSYFVLFLNDLAKELNNKNYETPSSHQDPKPRRVLTTEKIPPKASVNECPIHNSASHPLSSCNTFLMMSLPEKRKRLAQHRWCFSCMGDHIKTDCNVKVSCEKCHGSHHTAMHVAKATSSSAKSSSKISNTRGKNENKYVNAIQEFQSENDVTGQNNNSKSNKSLCTNVPGAEPL